MGICLIERHDAVATSLFRQVQRTVGMLHERGKMMRGGGALGQASADRHGHVAVAVCMGASATAHRSHSAISNATSSDVLVRLCCRAAPYSTKPLSVEFRFWCAKHFGSAPPHAAANGTDLDW